MGGVQQCHYIFASVEADKTMDKRRAQVAIIYAKYKNKARFKGCNGRNAVYLT